MTSATDSSPLLTRLHNSDYKNIRQDFTQHLAPFSDFISLDFDSSKKSHKPLKSKKKKPESTVDSKLIHPLAKQFLSFLNTALKLLPNRIAELHNQKSSKQKDEEVAFELLDVYKMCVECLNFVSPCLVRKGYSLHFQRLGLVHCYEVWGKCVEAEVEALSILDTLISDHNNCSKKKKNDCRSLPELVVGENEDPELARLVVEVVARIVKSAVRSQKKDDVVCQRVISLVDQVGPWYRVLDTKAFEKLHPDVVANLCKYTRFMEGEDACLDGDSVHKFCMETLTERLESSPKDPFLKITQNICSSLSSMWSSRFPLILDIFSFLLDYITCDCKVGMKDTVNEFLNVVHYCVKGCCLTNTSSSKVVGQQLGKLASNLVKVLVPIDLILKLYAAGLCFTKMNFLPVCAESELSLAESLITHSVHSREDHSYLADVLRSLASYFHVPNNTSCSLECSIDCKSKHGNVSFLSYLNALAFFCHPYAVLFSEASKVVLTEKKFSILSPNIVYTLEAFQQFCDAFLMYFSYKSEMEREKFNEIQNMLCHVAVAALIVSIRIDTSIKKTVLHIESIMSSWWIQLKSVKFLIASLHNIGVELYNTKQMKQASDVFELCCRCTWACIENSKASDWSEDAMIQFVASACSKSAILLDVLHQCGRPEKDLNEYVESILVKWSVVANLHEHLGAPTELVRKWVKIMCRKYTSVDAVEFDKVWTLYSLLGESLNKNGSSTLVTKRTIRIILEQELLAYEEYEAYNSSLCQKMQLNITEILLLDVYVTKSLQKSKSLIKKGRLLRAHGIGALKSCIDCLSEAISILIDLSKETTLSCPEISHHLALAYCLHALCTQEEAQPNSKVILEDIHCASELWLGIDWTVDVHYELVTENVIQLLCCVADLLSIKGHYDIQCKIYKLVIRFLMRKSVPPEKCLSMLWADRRLTHALCVKPIDENAISTFAQQFGATCDIEAVRFWLSCIEASQPLLVGFRQKLSIYDSNLSQVGLCHPGNLLLSNVTVDEVNEAASILNASVHIANSGFLIAYLYYDLSESLISSGQLTGALSFAKKALQIRTKLLRKKFIYSFGKQPQNLSGTVEFCPGNESDHAQIEIIGSVATEVWPNLHSWNLNQCNLSQWNVLQCYLESILQVGNIHETLGNASIAEAFLVQGKCISSKEGLPIFRVAFASALGVIYCKKQLWNLAETELKSAKQILVDGSHSVSSKLGNLSMINCKQCKISFEVTIDQRIGDLIKNRSDGTTHSLVNRFSIAQDMYREALKKVINNEQNTDPQPNQRNTRSRGRSLFNRKVKVREVEPECIKNLIRNTTFGCPSTHSWGKQSLEMNRSFTAEFSCTGNRKRCWKCHVVKVMETGNMQEFIHMKWNNHCRRLSLKLLDVIGQCLGECSEIHEMHDIFWQSITMLFDKKEFCQSYSGPDPLVMVFAWKEKSGNIFAIERATVLYNLAWFSLKKMHSRITCCDMSLVQLSSLVSWLLQAFILSREVPLLFQKVSRLLATIFVLSTSSEPLFSSLCLGKKLTGSHWAAFFHQASLGNYFNHQLCENPHLLKVPSTDDFLVSSNAASTETLTELFNLLRFEPENLFDLEKVVIEFFQSLPCTPVICISLLGRDYAILLVDILPGQISSSACLFLSRMLADDEPIVMLIPSDMIHEDKKDDEKYPTLCDGTNLNTKWVCPWGSTVVDDVAPQFKLILEENYLSSSSCLMDDTQENRTLWWTWRKKLNDRLDNMVREIEESWLGPWKCLFLGEPVVSTWLDSLLQRLNTALKCNYEFNANENLLRLVLGGSRSVSEIEICISQLLHKGCITRRGSYSDKTLVSSSTSRSPVDSISGEWLHQLILDANYDFEAECTNRDAVILVLDSDVQMLPWENLPVLRKMEVYRMPSVGSIPALIKGNIHRQEKMGKANGTFPSIDPLDAFYLLNPSGDLKCSQLDFEEWFRDQKLEGKAGTPPSVEELVLALKDRDLFIYIGHGSGAQYIPRHEIQKLDSCAATLLMGCSSGSLPFVGCYNPQGAVLSYLLAGSPAIIANLWEVTDKDIDRFGKNLLRACLQERSAPSIGCNPTNLREEFESMAIESDDGNRDTEVSRARKIGNDNGSSRHKGTRGHRPKIAAFMGQARDACTLPFLIGAAPVCYGVPTGIRRKEKVFAAT